MNVWSLKSIGEKYKSYLFVNEDKEYRQAFGDKVCSGERQNGEIDYAEIKIYDGTEDSDMTVIYDIPFVPVISERAKRCLEDLIKDEVEFIPVKCKDNTMYIINTLTIIDGIDYENSVYRDTYYAPPGVKLRPRIVKHVLKEDKVKDSNIFRVLCYGKIRTTMTFVSSEVKSIIEENSLTGFEFEEIMVSIT